MDNVYKMSVDFLRAKLNSSTTIDEIEKKYRFEHSLRVANIAKTIAVEENLDILTTTIAAILHDVGKFDTDDNIEHGRVSAEVALPFLKNINISNKQIDDIHYFIASHVDGSAGYEYIDSIEAETVSDADNIDRFGTYRIYQYLSWDKIELLPIDECILKYTDMIDTLSGFKQNRPLATITANKMFAKNLNIEIEFFKNLINELNLTNFSSLN